MFWSIMCWSDIESIASKVIWMVCMLPLVSIYLGTPFVVVLVLLVTHCFYCQFAVENKLTHTSVSSTSMFGYCLSAGRVFTFTTNCECSQLLNVECLRSLWHTSVNYSTKHFTLSARTLTVNETENDQPHWFSSVRMSMKSSELGSAPFLHHVKLFRMTWDFYAKNIFNSLIYTSQNAPMS